MPKGANARVFEGYQYFIHSSLTPHRIDELKELLNARGASEAPPAKDGEGRVDVDEVTHFVTDTLDFPERDLIDKEKVHVVTPRWVERSVAIGKQDPRYYSPDPAMFFSGMCVCVDDMIELPDMESIFAAVESFGGRKIAPLTKEVTHLVSLGPGGAKHQKAVEHAELGIKVVLPHWILDCVTVKQYIHETTYLFPDPPLMRTLARADPSGKLLEQSLAPQPGNSAEQEDFYRTVMHTQYSPDPATKPPRLPRPDAELRCLEGRRLCLDSELGLTPLVRGTMRERIEQAGGEVVDERKGWDDADIFITKYREGRMFLQAYRQKKTIATLPWLYQVLRDNVLRSPRDHLLHYPYPRGAIPGFEDYTITITNYTGNAREYLKTLIGVMGGTFTATMTQANTQVIAATTFGEKVARAADWNIPVVNHLWLEDCFKRWTACTVGNPRYTNSSPAFNFMSLLARRDVLTDEDLAPWVDVADENERGEEREDTEDAEVREDEEMQVDAEIPQITQQSTAPKSKPKQPLVVHASVVTSAGKQATPVRAPTSAEQDGDEDEEMEEGDMTVEPPKFKSKSKRPAPPRKGSAAEPIDVDEDERAEDEEEDEDARPKKMRPTSSRSASRDEEVDEPKRPKKTRPTSAEEDGAGPLKKSRSTASAAGADVRPELESPVKVDKRQKQKPGPGRNSGSFVEPPARSSKKRGSSPPPPEDTPAAKSKRARQSPSSSPTTTPRMPAPPEDGHAGPGTGSSRRPSSRAAALSATKALHEAGEDMVKWEKEKRDLKKGKGRAWEEEEDRGSPRPRRRKVESDGQEEEDKGESSSTAQSGDEEEDEEEEQRKVKATRGQKEEVETKLKGRKHGLSALDLEDLDLRPPASTSRAGAGASTGPKRKVAILTTGVTLTDAQSKKLKKLGARILERADGTPTHLVAKGISRTEKFLTSISHAPKIVNQQWVVECVKKGEFVDEEPYMLKDEESEERYGFNLREALDKASKKKVLQGHLVYITPSVSPTFDILRSIIKSAGGAATKTTPTPRIFGRPVEKGYTRRIVVSCEADKKIWKPLAEQRDAPVPIFTHEAILDGVLTQKFEYSTKYRVPGSMRRDE